MKTSSIIIGIAIVGIGGYLAYKFFTKKRTQAQTENALPTFASFTSPTHPEGGFFVPISQSASVINLLQNAYGTNVPIYYQPGSGTAYINKPAKGGVYVT